MITESSPTRQDKLLGWLRTHRITNVMLAFEFGLTPPALSNILKSEKISPHRLKQIQAYKSPMTGESIPEELLPAPSKGKPGPISSLERG